MQIHTGVPGGIQQAMGMQMNVFVIRVSKVKGSIQILIHICIYLERMQQTKQILVL